MQLDRLIDTERERQTDTEAETEMPDFYLPAVRNNKRFQKRKK